VKFARGLVDVRRQEIGALLLSFAYFFFILTSYFILRPVRELVGASHDSRELALLFTGTLAAMVVANPVYGWVVSRWPRRVFIPWVYRFFGLNLLAFFVLWKLHPEAQPGPIAKSFFIWLSVFNLFIVSVFWSFMADVFGLEPSKRLFGFIAAGGSLGGVMGPVITKTLVGIVGTTNLLLVSLVFLELATQCVLALVRIRGLRGEVVARTDARAATVETADSGDMWNGLRLVLSSPYLLLIAAHFLLASGIGTTLYFEQSQLVAAASPDKVERTRLFATIDIWTNGATFASQLFLTKAVVKRFGIGVALILQPVVAVAALVSMAISPTLAVLVAAQVSLRTLQHSMTRPSREMLFTVLGREVKYKAKSFVDTFVYRLGDQLGAWGFDGLKGGLGLSLGAIAWATVPLTLAWCGVAAALGRRQRSFAREPVTG